MNVLRLSIFYLFWISFCGGLWGCGRTSAVPIRDRPEALSPPLSQVAATTAQDVGVRRRIGGASLRRGCPAEEMWEEREAERTLAEDAREESVFVVWPEPLGEHDIRLNVFGVGENDGRDALPLLLRKLGFQSEKVAGVVIWRRPLTAREVSEAATRTTLEIQTVAAEAKNCRKNLKATLRAGSLGPTVGDTPRPGRRIFTGAPMDFALHDDGASARLFVAVETEEPPPELNLRRGETSYARSGRLFIGADGHLRVPVGPLAGLSRTPHQTVALSLEDDGRVIAFCADGLETPLGRMRLKVLDRCRADETGRVFIPIPPHAADPLDAEATASDRSIFLFGCLEYGETERQAALLALRDARKRLALLRTMLVTLRCEAARPATIIPTAPPNFPSVESAVRYPSRLVFFTEMPWTNAQLKALKQKVATEGGRLTLEWGDGETSHKTTTDALIAILRSLSQKLLLHRENWLRAEEVREEAGVLTPYQRRFLDLTPDGTTTIKPDPAPFFKKYKPNDKFADKKTGLVVLPNVDRSVEAAEFSAARAEYEILREALQRLAPEYVFPPPPEPPGASRAPSSPRPEDGTVGP